MADPEDIGIAGVGGAAASLALPLDPQLTAGVLRRGAAAAASWSAIGSISASASTRFRRMAGSFLQWLLEALKLDLPKTATAI